MSKHHKPDKKSKEKAKKANKARKARSGVDMNVAAADVAIVGLALKLPGADDLDGLWEILKAGRSTISEVPADRWDAKAMLGNPAKEANKTSSIWGGFVDAADRFDAAFFNISPREAQSMDPQQRFVLELSWRAMEDAGYAPTSLAGTRTGVFMGVCHWDYAELFEKSGLPVDAYLPTGTAYSIIANRVSYFFDFIGPSVVNDTACSSSLVAVQQAVQSLRAGECSAALAGGVNLIWSPNHFVAFSKNGMLSKTGRSRAFERRADGYVRGEGAVVLMLKTLEQALADGDSIHAVIKGVGSNHGGRTSALTVTNPRAQAQLIHDVHAAAGIHPDTVTYMEAHGTGTLVGDPIEMLGLKTAFTQLYQTFGGQPRAGHCGVGSVKTNIGHLEGAAGVAGMVKVIAAMRHGQLPPNVDFQQPNPLLKLDGTPFRIIDSLQPWPEGPSGTPHRAGISSFGFGGTNAHVLLEAPPRRKPARDKGGAVVVPLSARDPERLAETALGLANALDAQPTLSMTALAYTLQTGRTAMNCRLALIADDPAELSLRLRAFADGQPIARAWHGEVRTGTGDAPEGSTPEHLAQAWAAGATVDFSRLYPDGVPERLRLPTYPFARDRHWFPAAPAKTDAGAAARIHPLLHENRSSLFRHTYAATLKRDAFYLADHLIGGRHVLPGVAGLEMARAAALAALDAPGDAAIELTGVVWLRPVTAVSDAIDVEMRLERQPDNSASFRLTTDGDTVCWQGSASLTARAETRLDLTELRGLCPEQVTPDECYARLRAAGIEHGAAFRALSAIVTDGAALVVADLTLPQDQRLEDSRWDAHPVMVDAAIQAVVALIPGGHGAGVPFAVDRVVMTSPCTRHMVAVIRRPAPGRFDIALCHADGRVSLRLDNLTTRALDAKPAEPELVCAAPEWRPVPAPHPPSGSDTNTRPLAIMVAIDTLPPELSVAGDAEILPLPTSPSDAEGAERCIAAVLDRAQSLLRGGDTGRLLVALPTDDVMEPALAALLKTISLESSRIDGRLVSVEGLQRCPAAELTAILAQAASGESVHCRVMSDGTWLTRRFAAVSPAAAAPWRQDGVYWITGGLGGLGRLFATHLAAAGVTRIILSGRTAPTTPLPANMEFLPVDVSDAHDTARAVHDIIARHGRLTGVLHCAGILRDGLAATKTAEDRDAVLAAKVRGTVNLDAATTECGLDLFAVCSSIASVHGNAGQSDYAAGNGFVDGFVEWRQRTRPGRSVAINWPLWEQGGMQVRDTVREAQKRRMGVIPLPTSPGLRALDAVLAWNGSAQVAVGFGAAAEISRFFAHGDSPAAPPSAPSETKGDTTILRGKLIPRLRELLGEVLSMAPQKIRPDVAFEVYGFDSIVAVDMIGRLEAEIGGMLPKTLFFEVMNLDGVADYLLANHTQALAKSLLPAEQPSAPPPPSPPAAPAQAIPTAAPMIRPARDRHDIAVIGIGGRYPGAENLDQFWDNLCAGRHAFTPIPVDRWPHEQIYFNERDIMGKSTIQTGGFLTDIDAFDPRYFSISQRDAELMSPEVRLLLQAAVETFEDAGYSRETLQSRFDGDVGVLVGTMSNHYNLYGVQNMLTRGARASGSYTGTMPNMISYYYGLTGPSLFVDTMCSASSTAIDLAVRLLREGQCRMALAGGVNLLLHPHNLISSSQEHFTSKTAEVIRSFGLGADGTILGEGVGTVLLKPLVDAERDGDNIQAVIKGTAMTNAGVRNGFTVPNPAMQAKAIRLALDDAGVNARTISYVEAHGSGTKLGDPIEIAALKQAFGTDTDQRGYCAIGSVKSNIAHLLAAAGIVGFTKLLLQLRHGKIVPSLHSRELNPAIDFANSPFTVQQELSEWRRPVVVENGVERTLPRRAGITSIGAGGMNSHIVVEEYAATETERHFPGPHLAVFSAMSPAALDAVLERMAGWLERHPQAGLAAVTHTLQVGRTALPCRLAVIAGDLAELRRAITAFRDGDPSARRLYTADVLAVEAPDGNVEAALANRDLDAVARAWLAGAGIPWDRLWPQGTPRRISLPTYPFAKVRCWYEVFEDAPSVLNPEAFRRRLHPLIQRNVSDLKTVGFATDLRLDDLLDYGFRVSGAWAVVAPFTLDATLAALRLAGAEEVTGLAHLCWHSCDWTRAHRLDYVVDAAGPGVSILWQDKDGASHPLFEATAAHRAAPPPAPLPRVEPETVLDGAAVRAALAEAGLDFSPYLLVVERLELAADGSGCAHISPPAMRQDHHKRSVSLRPEVLGGLAQVLILLARHQNAAQWASVQPVSAGSFSLSGDAQVAELRFRLPGLRGDVQLLDTAGRVVGELRDMVAAVADDTGEGSSGPATDVSTTLRREMARILKFAPEQIDDKTGFYTLGFDSISLTELTDRINTSFATNLTPAVFYEVENLEQLTGMVAKLRPARQAVARPAPRPTPTRSPAPSVRATPTAMGEPVAIVGLAGRFPGCDDVDALARLLAESRQSLSLLPLDRYGPAYAARIKAAGFPLQGGFLADLARFDCAFFNISPAEAEMMDPQHRLFLETAWATLENAGRRPTDLPEDTGIFIGVSAHDYASLLQSHGIEADGWVSTGTSHAMLANRVSYLLDVHGPSEAIDTACSSSLVAVHRAVEAIRAGRCAMALAGGVNVTLSLDSFMGPYRAGMLSPDGRCKTFSDTADGYVRGEGVGAVLLKPLSAAMRDGDPIHGVIIGSAENHGGRASSLTAPNTRAQTDLIARALAGIDPGTIDYVEAHGTGTALGDPVEVNALKQAFIRVADSQGVPLFPGRTALGSVKTNIGHLEAAAGMAGIAKVLVSLRENLLPATLDCARLNPYLELDGSPFRVLREPHPWTGERRRAGISSFGFGGANAHLVIESAPVEPPPQPRPDAPALVVLSARTSDGLERAVATLLSVIERPDSPDLHRLAFTLQVGREPMEERLAVIADSLGELRAALSDRTVRRGRVSLVRGFPEPRQAGDLNPAPDHLYASGALDELARHWLNGGSVDWLRLHGGTPPRRVALPPVPFAGARHWLPLSGQELSPPPTPESNQVAASVMRLLDDLIDGRTSVEDASRTMLEGDIR